MKKFINEPARFIDEMLEGMYASFGQSVVGQYFHNVSNFCIVSISTWIFSLVIAL